MGTRQATNALDSFASRSGGKGIFPLECRDAKFADGGTLFLFGGGIALSDAMFKTGVVGWIARIFVEAVRTPSTIVLVIVIVLLVDFLTELTLN